MLRLTLAIFCLLACLQTASARPRRRTNADRFARGLPPLAPRTLYDASRISTAHRSKRSATPPPDPFECFSNGAYTQAQCCDANTVVAEDGDGHYEGSVCYGTAGQEYGDCSTFSGTEQLCCSNVNSNGDGTNHVSECVTPPN